MTTKKPVTKKPPRLWAVWSPTKGFDKDYAAKWSKLEALPNARYNNDIAFKGVRDWRAVPFVLARSKR